MTPPPSRPEASRSSSRSSGLSHNAADGPATMQAGRSSMNLAAEQSAQSLHEASRRLSRPPSQSSLASSHSRNKSRPLIDTNVAPLSDTTSSRQMHSAGAGLRRPSIPHTPAVSSPLNPTPSRSGSEATVSRKNSNETANASSSASEEARETSRMKGAPRIGVAVPHPPTTRAATLRPPEMTQSLSQASLSRLSTPRSVRDLGSDYTRYFNPFASSTNSSRQDLSNVDSTTHLMAGTAAVDSADTSKRFSNPFRDTKRLSNPFDSARNTAPTTPQQKHATPATHEKSGGPIDAVPLPARTGTPQMIRDADPETGGFFPYMDDRLGAPVYALPLMTDEKEADDDMHMPQWDDDVKLKPKWRDHFTRENIASTFGMVFMLAGLLCIFVVLPVVSYTGTSLIDYYYETPLDQMPGYGDQDGPAWAHVNNKTYSLLENIRTGLIDPDTPDDAKTRTSIDGDTLNLVFSDEFNAQNRTFYPGDDPFWFGFDGWYGATQDLEWYDPDAINTGGGTLQLQMDMFENHDLQFRSGMLNSWNQLCFKGGVFEVSMSLPGPAGVHGLWPGVWTMGNLGRPGYLSTTDGMWPYTYDTCDTGITNNQSMTDGTSNLPGQRLSSCTCSGEDHPTPGTGRGAPEIDIAEVSGDWGGLGLGVATQSFQVAPFDIWYYPNYDFMETPNYNLSYVNTYTGGPYQQAVSTTTMLNNQWYDGKEYQKYAFEYSPGGDENAFIAWTIGEEEMMRFDGRAVGPNGNVGQRLVSEEPMSIIMNLGISHSWVDVEFAQLVFPTVLQIDYVRWYQKEGEEMVTCDPPGYETTDYILQHPAAYNNPNFTHWVDTGYSWPQNSFVDGCEV